MTSHTHNTAIVRVGGSFRGGCTCKQRGPIVTERYEAEDWGISHLVEIERVRLRLRGQPSLAVAMKQYYAAAEDEQYSEPERDLWRQMAEEIDHRLNGSGEPAEQLKLFP